MQALEALFFGGESGTAKKAESKLKQTARKDGKGEKESESRNDNQGRKFYKQRGKEN